MQMLDARQQGEQGFAGGNDFNQPRFNAPQQGGGYQNNNQGGGYGQNNGGYGGQGGFGNGGNSPQGGGFAPKAPQQPASAPFRRRFTVLIKVSKGEFISPFLFNSSKRTSAVPAAARQITNKSGAFSKLRKVPNPPQIYVRNPRNGDLQKRSGYSNGTEQNGCAV